MIHRFQLFALLLLLSPTADLLAAPTEATRPLTFSGPRFQVEDLSADLHSDGNILVITGKIKNLGYDNVRGYLTIYLKDAHHDVLRSVEVEINENQPIPTGVAAPFETLANIEGIHGLANVSVEFIEAGSGQY